MTSTVTQQLIYTIASSFEAARRIPLLPEKHRSSRIHGHSFLADARCLVPENWACFPGGEVEALRMTMNKAISPLDYRFLNEIVDQPTDENLARWIRSHLDLPNILSIGVQSTLHEGVDLDENDYAHIWRRYVFESAHQLPNVSIDHKCGRMHGHSFEVILHANQSLEGKFIGIDYDYLDEIWASVHAELDHACLNDIPGLQNPTSEMISSWIWNKLKPQLPELSWITVYETSSCGAHFDGQNYRIWKEMTLDCALQLKRSPYENILHRIHGHTYTLRLHLHSKLDQVMGWTVDFGDVKELFNPIFKRLDHHPLHELEDLNDCDVASLAYWIRDKAYPYLPQLDRIDIYETRGCGVMLTWGELGPALPI